MVAPIILAGGLIAGIIFFARGGLEQFQAFAESVVTTEDKQKGTQVIPTLQSGKGSVPLASGSTRTINSIESENILRTNVADKRKFAPLGEQPPIQTFFNNPKEGGVLASQRGQIVGANLSIQSGQQFGNAQFGLNQNEINEIRGKDFTDQELQDIANLQARFNRKSASAQRVSDSPEEIVLKKREQEAIAIKVLGGLTKQNFPVSGVRAGIQVEGIKFGQAEIDFTRINRGLTPRGFSLGGGDPKGGFRANPAFALGGITPEEFTRQRIEKEEIFAKQIENKILQEQRKESGEQVITTIKKSGLNQKQFFAERGFNIIGGNQLSALAIGKLLAGTSKSSGIDLSTRRVDPVVEKAEPVRQLTSEEVFLLSDAEKIARFRRGERFTWVS